MTSHPGCNQLPLDRLGCDMFFFFLFISLHDTMTTPHPTTPHPTTPILLLSKPGTGCLLCGLTALAFWVGAQFGDHTHRLPFPALSSYSFLIKRKKKLVRQLSEFNLRWDLIFLLLFSRRWSLGDQPIVDSGFILSSPIRPFFLFFILLSSLCPCAATQLWTNMGRRNLNTRHLCGIRSIGGSMDGRDRHDDPPTTTIMREDGVVTLTLTLTKDNAHQATSQAKGYRTLFFFFPV